MGVPPQQTQHHVWFDTRPDSKTMAQHQNKVNKSNGPAPQQAWHADKCRVSAGPASATPNHERPTLEPRFIEYGMEGNIDLMSDVYI